MIKINKIQVISVHDWDDLVKDTYGKQYNFQQQDFCKEPQRVKITVPVKQPYDYENDTIPGVIEIRDNKMGVSFKGWLERDSDAPLNTSHLQLNTCKINNMFFWHRKFYPHIDMLINDLHAKGLLPAGDYEIDIDW
jgi:hypothetical protein